MGPLFPFLAALFFRRHYGPSSQSATLDVLIPAHNEAAIITATIRSIQYAAPSARIFIGADACTDSTANLARGLNAEVIEFQNKSKWRTLLALLEYSRADWVAFVDAGALWPQQLGQAVLSVDDSIAAVAPAYQNEAGRAEKLHWLWERLLKAIESQSVGPVSVHGATVFYRRRALNQALLLLREKDWLNDDVAIPSAIHAANAGRIQYRYDLVVQDLGANAPERGRRLRLVKGNIEWAKELFPRLTKNRVALLVSLRRFFRLFWAYWLVALAVGACFFSGLGLFALLPFCFFPRAALSSLAVPFLLFRKQETRWK